LTQLDGPNPKPTHKDETSNNLEEAVEVTCYPRIETAKLPEELLLYICEFLESEDLLAFAEAWPKIGDVIASFNVIRTRELQCFCLKKGYMTSKLGIGVALSQEKKGNIPLLVSEFDILSEEAFG